MHRMAKEYGKLPSDLLKLEWWEYDFNAAVLLAGIEAENRPPNKRPLVNLR